MSASQSSAAAGTGNPASNPAVTPATNPAAAPASTRVPALPTAATPEEVGLSRPRLQRISAHWQAEVDACRLPGAVVLVSRHGKIAYLDAIGKLDAQAGTPMSVDAIFRIFSMTKPIVSVAVMMLIEQAKMRLLDPVSKFLPEFAVMNVGVPTGGEGLVLVPAKRPITIQDLLRHTSGLTYEFTGTSPVHKLYGTHRLGDRNQTNKDDIARLAKVPLLVEPATRWEYSRSTDVLGRLIEVISGLPLGEFLRRHIFEPLGMFDTAFSVDESRAHRIAEPLPGTSETPEAVKLFNPRRVPAAESGGGGLMSTALDYARFLQMMLNGGILNGERLLSRKTVELMTADHLGDIPCSSDLLPPGQGFGLGFAVRKFAGVAPFPGSVGTYYWSGIAGTAFWVDPVERLFAVLMTQAPNYRIENGAAIRNLVYASVAD